MRRSFLPAVIVIVVALATVDMACLMDAIAGVTHRSFPVSKQASLSGTDIHKNEVMQYALPKSQVQLANSVAAYLSEHMDQRITIAELSKRFGVSDTHLKNAFKGVYGMPVFSYMRVQKMQAAAQLLIHTEKPIAEIADEFGYSNTSKFSSAFQPVMGDTPGDCRRLHTKVSEQ